MNDEHSTNVQYTFNGLKCRPANAKILSGLIKQFEEKYPVPVPPKIPVKTFEAVVSGKGFEMMDDPEDAGYLTELRKHRARLYVLKESFFLKTCVFIQTEEEADTLTSVLIDQDKRIGLFNYIVSISWLTADAVAVAMAELGYTWYGKPIHTIKTPQSPGVIPVAELAYQAASEMYRLEAWELDKVPIPTQANMVARYILVRRMAYLQEKERAAELEAKRRQRSGKRSRINAYK